MKKMAKSTRRLDRFYDALLAQKGHYAELHNTYLRHQSLVYVEGAREFVEGD